MNIVILISYFQPKLGYADFYLAQELQKKGHRVSVITSNYYFPFPDYKNSVYKILGERKRKIGIFTERGIRVYRLPFLYQSRNSAVTFLIGLGKTLLKIKPDVVLVESIFSPLAAQIAYYKDGLNFRVFYDNHASTFNTKLRNSLVKKTYMFVFGKLLIPFIKKKADGFMAVGSSEKHLLCKEYGLGTKDVKLIPLGSDARLFAPNKKDRLKTRQVLRIKKKDILLVCAGKITPNKDVHILLEALNIVSDKSNNSCKLLLLGGGDKKYIVYLNKYTKENLLQSKVIWKGMVNNKELPKYYNASDIGIWPGNLSNAIIEAMSCGLPIILPKEISKGQTSSHLLKNDNGLDFKRGSSKDLASQILELLSCKEKLNSMGKNSRKLVEKEYSWENITKDFLRFVHE